MNKFLKQLKKEAERIALTREEKERGRAILRAFIDTHPSAAGAAITAVRHAFRIPFGARLAMNVFASFLVMTLVGGGVALGAERALPGDALYPIKININEKIVGALKSADEKPGWEATLAERRLDEAEDLAARGKLDEQTKTALAVQFDAHVDKAVAGTDALSARNAAAAAFETNSRLEASLKAHAEILDKMLLPRHGGARAEEVYAAPDILAAKVREKEEMIRGKRLAAEGMFVGKTDAATKAVAEKNLRTAKQEIEEARKRIASTVSRGGAPTEGAVELDAASLPVQMTAVQAIEDAVSAGEEKFAAGDAGGAYVSFREALREAERAKQVSEAEKKFGISISAPQAPTVPPSDHAELPAGGGDEPVAAPPALPVPKSSADSPE